MRAPHFFPEGKKINGPRGFHKEVKSISSHGRGEVPMMGHCAKESTTRPRKGDLNRKEADSQDVSMSDQDDWAARMRNPKTDLGIVRKPNGRDARPRKADRQRNCWNTQQEAVRRAGCYFGQRGMGRLCRP